MRRSRRKDSLQPRRQIKERRRLAEEVADDAAWVPSGSGAYENRAGPHGTVPGALMDIKGKKHTYRIATLGHTSHHYDPVVNIARSINDALEHDPSTDPVTIQDQGDKGACTRVRAEILAETKEAYKLRVYKWRGWLPKAWAEDLKDGTFRLALKALCTKKYLSNAIKEHRAQMERLKR